MKTKNVLILTALILTAGMWVGAAAAQTPPAAQQPTLGDMARQNKSAKAKRVITDDDMPSRPAQSASSSAPSSMSSSASASAQGTTSSKGDAAAAPDGKAQPAMKDGDKPADGSDVSEEDAKKIAYAKRDVDALESNIKILEVKVATAEGENRKRIFGDALDNARKQLAEFKAAQEQVESDIAAKKNPKEPQ